MPIEGSWLAERECYTRFSSSASQLLMGLVWLSCAADHGPAIVPSRWKGGNRPKVYTDLTVAPHVFKKSEIEAMMGSASKVKMPKEREQPKVGPVIAASG
jgi:hypothetical protein